jgi:hypothetical protein
VAGWRLLEEFQFIKYFLLPYQNGFYQQPIIPSFQYSSIQVFQHFNYERSELNSVQEIEKCWRSRPGSTEPSLTALIVFQNLHKFILSKIGPQGICYINFRIRDLPQ